MARKNLLDGLADVPTTSASSNYPMRGAGKSLVRSLDELAAQADKFLEGEAVVELDPDHIVGSFVKDRLSDDDEEFVALVEAIRVRGQDSPVLVRPHPKIDGRYQVVFGHRRVKAARQLGRKVRAVVKSLDDRSHVIAQGQENSARANLSFIERAMFARGLEDLGYDREIISTALAANAASVSKMMSVTERIPAATINAIGSAPGVGRERWLELSLLVGKAASAKIMTDTLSSEAFSALPSDERFTALYKALNKTSRPAKKVEAASSRTKWQARDRSIQAEIKNTGKAFSLSIKAKNAGRFGEYLSHKLDALYEQFVAEETQKGD